MLKNGLEYLKSLELKEIQQKTHISFYNLEAILNRSYAKLEPVHFTGFVSILEREYGIDLSDISKEYEAYVAAHVIEKPASANTFVKERKEHKKRKVLLVLLLLIAVAAGLFLMNRSNQQMNHYGANVIKELNDSQIEEAKEKLVHLETLTPYMEAMEENATATLESEENATFGENNLSHADELNATQVGAIVSEMVKQENVPEEIALIPRKKVWIGMIELPSMKKTNRVTTRKISVDQNKDTLIVFGHGQIDIQKNGELLSFNNSNKLYFIYEQGKLREIDSTEFKLHNQGKIW